MPRPAFRAECLFLSHNLPPPPARHVALSRGGSRSRHVGMKARHFMKSLENPSTLWGCENLRASAPRYNLTAALYVPSRRSFCFASRSLLRGNDLGGLIVVNEYRVSLLYIRLCCLSSPTQQTVMVSSVWLSRQKLPWCNERPSCAPTPP